MASFVLLPFVITTYAQMFASAHGWMKEKEGMGAVSGRQTGIYTAINHGARPSVRERRIAHLDDDDEGVAHGRADGRRGKKRHRLNESGGSTRGKTTMRNEGHRSPSFWRHSFNFEVTFFLNMGERLRQLAPVA